MSLLDPTMFESFRELGLLDKHLGRFQEIWNVYLTNTTEAIAKLQKSNLDADRTDCMNLLHKIKGSSLNLGLTRLGHFAGALEQHLKANVYSLHESEIDLLEQIFRDSKAEMDAKLNAIKNGGTATEMTAPH